jgi:O-antigen ligase
MQPNANLEAGSTATRRKPLFGAFAVLLALALVFGLLNFLREPPSGDFHAEWMALVFFCLAAAALVPLLPRRYAVSWTLLAWPGALGLLLIYQAAAGQYVYAQVPLLWGGYLLLAMLAMVLGQGIRAAGLVDEVTNRVAWALLIAAVLNTGAQFAQAARVEAALAPFVVSLVNTSVCRLYGNIGQANQASTLAWLGIAAALYLNGVGRLRSPWALPLLAILLVGSALSASRMAWLFAGLLAVIIVSTNAWPSRDRRARWMSVAMILGGFALASIGAERVLGAVDPICLSGLERFAEAGGGGGVQIRKELWRQSIEVWKTSPLTGVGAMNFLPTVYQIARLDQHQPLDTYVHNTALQVLAEFGLVGAGVLAAVALIWLHQLFTNRRRLGSAEAFLIAVLGVLATHAMLEFPLHYTYFLLVASLALGMLIRAESALSPLFGYRVPAFVLAAALLVGAGLVFHDYRRLDRLFWLEDQRMAFSAAPTPEVRALMADAAAGIWIFESYRDHLLGLSDPITDLDLKRKISDTDRVLVQSPQPIVMARRIALAILDDDLESARWHLRRMFGFFPGQAPEMADQLRRFVVDRPDEFAALGPMLDEELARRPAARW